MKANETASMEEQQSFLLTSVLLGVGVRACYPSIQEAETAGLPQILSHFAN